jgi:hypothetical protein
MFYRSANLIITSSVMGCLAIAAVALRFWARKMRKMNMGADDILSFVGLVRLFLDSPQVCHSLNVARFWRLVCAFASLSALPNSDLEAMNFSSNPVLSRAGL